MSPEQQTALEALAGRPLTAGEMAALEPLVSIRNDVAVAAILSADRVRLTEHLVTERGVLAALGPVEGDALLAALEAITSPETLPLPVQPYYGAIRRGVSWLKNDGLDMGSPTARALLDLLAGYGVITPAHAGALKALAQQPDPIHYNLVSDRLNAAEGLLTLS